MNAQNRKEVDQLIDFLINTVSAKDSIKDMPDGEYLVQSFEQLLCGKEGERITIKDGKIVESSKAAHKPERSTGDEKKRVEAIAALPKYNKIQIRNLLHAAKMNLPYKLTKDGEEIFQDLSKTVRKMLNDDQAAQKLFTELKKQSEEQIRDNTKPVNESQSIAGCADLSGPKPQMEFKDISSEQYREYSFLRDGASHKVIIREPALLDVDKQSRAHRIVDSDGVSHYIPGDWDYISWKVKPGHKPFSF